MILLALLGILVGSYALLTIVARLTGAGALDRRLRGGSVSRIAGICLMAFLVAMYPANVYAAINHVAMSGHEA